jgi:hypothetical protein
MTRIHLNQQEQRSFIIARDLPRKQQDFELQQTNEFVGKVLCYDLLGNPVGFGWWHFFSISPHSPHTSYKVGGDSKKIFYNDLTMKRQEI